MVSKTKTTRLSEKAMLVKLSISVWTGRTKDKVVTNEVVEKKHAEHDAGAWWTYLIPKKAMKGINAAEDQCRKVFRELTLPWDDVGSRILPSKMFLKYSRQIKEAKQQFEEAVDEFIKEYPTILQEASKRLGDLNGTKPMPSANEIKWRFGIHQIIMPMPESSDFRVNLQQSDVTAIREQIEQEVSSSINKAMADIWGRLSELVGKMEDTLKQPKKVFRDTLVSNVARFCELMPDLNITDDPNIESIRKEVMTQLALLKPDELRNDKKVRKTAAQNAKSIMKKMEAYMK